MSRWFSFLAGNKFIVFSWVGTANVFFFYGSHLMNWEFQHFPMSVQCPHVIVVCISNIKNQNRRLNHRLNRNYCKNNVNYTDVGQID